MRRKNRIAFKLSIQGVQLNAHLFLYFNSIAPDEMQGSITIKLQPFYPACSL
jgi:hypothetical protein